MKMGVYVDGPRLKVIVYIAAEERRFLFKNATVVNNRIVMSYNAANGGEIIVRRGGEAETNALKITAVAKADKNSNYMLNLGTGRMDNLRLKNLRPHKAIDIPVLMTTFNSIPAIVTKHSDWLIDPVINVGPKEREKEPLYNPQDHSPEPVVIRHPAKINDNGHGALPNSTVSDLKTALEMLNALSADGVEFFVENGKVRAKMVTVL